MSFQKLTAFTKKVQDLADKPAIDTAELKATFDAAPEEVRTYLNNLIDALKKTTSGDSGAKNIGATPISGLSGSDVQSILESLKTTLDNTIVGQVTPDSIGAVPYTGATKEVNLNNKSLLNVKDFSLADTTGDGVTWKFIEGGYPGVRNGGAELRSYNADGSLKATGFYATTDGIFSVPLQSFVEAYRSTNLSVGSGIWTKVTGLTEQFDTQSEFTADEITVKDDGVYAFYANTSWASFTANRIATNVFINGSNGGTISEHSTSSSINPSGAGVVFHKLTKGDKIAFYVYQNNGSLMNCTSIRVRMVKVA